MKLLLLLCLIPLGLTAQVHPTGARDVTFISTSDAHYREPDHALGTHNGLNRASVEEINRIATQPWPIQLGGDPIGKPLGVLLPGDVIDEGDRAINGRKISQEQFACFLADFGLSGTEALLKFPVFEGWGNHDGPPEGQEKHGFSFQGQLKRRNQLRKSRGLISNLSANGLHYSWDWQDVHFVQLNLYPADKQNPKIHYPADWHDPQGSLSFLKEDLASKVGASGRPVVLVSHCGFDTNWWDPEDWAAVYEAAKAYNIVLYLYGHSGTGLKEWAPPGEQKKWTCINDGQTAKGFFVIQITEHRLRAAMRIKKDLKYSKSPEGKQVHEWGGEWEWKFYLNKSLNSP